MNKQQLIEAVAKRLELSRTRAGKVVDLFFSSEGIIATELVKKGGKVQISGFGNFEIRRRLERQGRNPRTGKTITIEPSIAPVFRAGKALKDVVNRKR
ncbi:MAG: HU family DNA-binding protein [Gemmatimonadales bacterium]